MKAFVLFVVVLMALENASRFIWLAKGDWPIRTRGQIVADVAFNFALILWGVCVLR